MSWASQLPPATSHLVTTFTDQLFKDGLLDKILCLLDSISIDDELRKLAALDNRSRIASNSVSGSLRTDTILARHQQGISEFVNEQRTGLAECLLYWACQMPFGKGETMKIVKYLQRVSVPTLHTSTAVAAADTSDADVPRAGVGCGDGTVPRTKSAGEFGVMDPVSLSLFHTLLACFNIGDHTPGECSARGGGLCVCARTLCCISCARRYMHNLL